MCNEFFLACLYFFIIFVINLFLYRLLNVYIKNILSLQKIKFILKNHPDNEFFTKLYKYSDKEFRNSNTLSNFRISNSETIDTLILGNIYKYIVLTNRNSMNSILTNDYYFQLLTSQYLSLKFSLK